MTAIIGILNKTAVSLAADSAVTVSNHQGAKTYNYANKIFNLSKKHPIAIAIYNNANFMGVPWETIIKCYRAELGDKEYKTVEEYRSKFLSYVKTNLKNYISEEDQADCLAQILIGLLNVIKEEYFQEKLEQLDAVGDINWVDIKSDEFNKKFTDILIESIQEAIKFIENKKDLDLSTSLHNKEVEKQNSHFDLVYDNFFSKNWPYAKKNIRIKRMIKKAVLLVIKKQLFFESHSGLVFTGFGKDELFPRLFRAEIGGVITNRIRQVIDDDSIIITKEMTSSIAPFAQTDIIHQFVEGIDPNLKSIMYGTFANTLNDFKNAVLDRVNDDDKTKKKLDSFLKKKIPQVLTYLFETLDNERREGQVEPILSTISNLSKEDLAELSESLINLTYLKRRATFDQESVGGPIDVAVITKGDGFIWIKRKHYFKPELNLNYISSVINNR